MRMGYNTMNVMRLGIDSLASARSHGFRCLYAEVSLPVCRGFAALHRLPVVCRPLRGLAMSLHIVCWGFTACSFTGVQLRFTACLWSAAPCGAWQCHCTSYAGGSPPVCSQGFRCAPPPACGLAPLRGLAMSLHIVCWGFTACSFTGVSLRSTACLWSAAPDGAKRMNEYLFLENFNQNLDFWIFSIFASSNLMRNRLATEVKIGIAIHITELCKSPTC